MRENCIHISPFYSFNRANFIQAQKNIHIFNEHSSHILEKINGKIISHENRSFGNYHQKFHWSCP